MYSMFNYTEPTYKDSLGMMIVETTGDSPGSVRAQDGCCAKRSTQSMVS